MRTGRRSRGAGAALAHLLSHKARPVHVRRIRHLHGRPSTAPSALGKDSARATQEFECAGRHSAAQAHAPAPVARAFRRERCANKNEEAGRCQQTRCAVVIGRAADRSLRLRLPRGSRLSLYITQTRCAVIGKSSQSLEGVNLPLQTLSLHPAIARARRGRAGASGGGPDAAASARPPGALGRNHLAPPPLAPYPRRPHTPLSTRRPRLLLGARGRRLRGGPPRSWASRQSPSCRRSRCP